MQNSLKSKLNKLKTIKELAPLITSGAASTRSVAICGIAVAIGMIHECLRKKGFSVFEKSNKFIISEPSLVEDLVSEILEFIGKEIKNKCPAQMKIKYLYWRARDNNSKVNRASLAKINKELDSDLTDSLPDPMLNEIWIANDWKIQPGIRTPATLAGSINLIEKSRKSENSKEIHFQSNSCYDSPLLSPMILSSKPRVTSAVEEDCVSDNVNGSEPITKYKKSSFVCFKETYAILEPVRKSSSKFRIRSKPPLKNSLNSPGGSSFSYSKELSCNRSSLKPGIPSRKLRCITPSRMAILKKPQDPRESNILDLLHPYGREKHLPPELSGAVQKKIRLFEVKKDK